MKRLAIAFAAVLTIGLAGCAPSQRSAESGEFGEPTLSFEQVKNLAEQIAGRVRTHAERIAGFGPRQTGQVGCQKTYEYIKAVFAELDGGRGTLREFGSVVTVPLDRWAAEDAGREDREHTSLEVFGLSAEPQRWEAFSFYPNNVQDCPTRPADEVPRRLVDLGDGQWEDLEGQSLAGAVVLLDYNSGDRWILARELGAYAAVFIEPEWTNWRQTDLKYLDMVPLYMPRIYVPRDKGLALREALAAGKDVKVVVRSRLKWRNVKAPCVEFTVPGEDPSRTYILISHFDARSIVPDLSYGGDEVWGVATLLELARFFTEHKPAVNLRFIAVSGHWQAQRCTRDYIAPGTPGFEEIGPSVRLILGLDLSTERPDLNLIRETAWDNAPPMAYRWIGNVMFREGGWHEEIRKGLQLDERGIGLFADERPFMVRTAGGPMAPRDWRCPLTYSPKFNTANEAWAAVGATTFAFQTAWLWRLHHNSPLDRFEVSASPERLKNLKPQLEMTLAVLDRLLQYPARRLPRVYGGLKSGATWGGYAQLRGRVQVWNPATGWFSTELPKAPGSREGESGEKRLRTFVYAVCLDGGFQAKLGGRERSYLAWPLAPHRRQHRELQSFMFRELRMLDSPEFRLNALQGSRPSASIDVLGYALDEEGRIFYATDFGVHGDGNPAFQCTDLRVNFWDMFAPVTLFPCGTVELFSLADVQRRSFNELVFGQYYILYSAPGNHEDRGVYPHVRVTEIRNAQSHTDMRSWGFVQYGPTALVFLPAQTEEIAGRTEPQRAEILLGTRLTKFTPLLNVDANGFGRGYLVEHGQTIRLNKPDEPAAAVYVNEQYRFDARRLREFAEQEVASPLANKYHAATKGLAAAAAEAASRKSWRKALAEYLFAWTNEATAYRYTIRLLLDVVSTTVFYFTLLIPFSFLVERLIFPQTNAVRTCLVAAGIFAVFVLVLYAFHPGFKLASNILVTIVAFLIVVMTIPALILLVIRGIGMLKAMGSKAIILQRSEAEKAGVVSAALSLSVSNMRRRKLRTTLTLATITTLVVALVLLTTATSFEFSLVEPQELAATSFYGIQLFNTADRRNALLPEMAEMLEALLADEALVLRREYVNYGYDPESANGCLYVEANGLRAPVPYVQFMAPEDALVEYRVALPDQPGRPEIVHLNELMRGPDGKNVWFDKDDVNVCMLPNTTAEQIGVRPGEYVEFMGIRLKVLGVWDAKTVQRDERGRLIIGEDGQPITSPGLFDRLTDLDAQPITPLKFAVVTQGDPDRPLHCASTEMILLPRRFHEVHRILPASPWSLIVIPKDLTRIPELARRLSKEVLNVDVFYHYTDRDGRDRIEMVSLRESTKVKGSGMMVFMLVIAVSMILAIMMGTVYERMREINIFSSVGLAPRHVAGMFFIEALVYAGIASVLGYFIGIVALSYMAHAKLLPENFYPNYLGVYVIYAIGVAMFATIASSVYPIRVASQMVNPSLERTWRIETEPQGDQWQITLPFIATSMTEVAGMMAYAYEFLAVHQGERAGKFVCQTPPAPVEHDGLPGVQMDIWLAPFERNVSQHAVLRAEAGDREGRWQFVLHLRRLSGPRYLWQRSNKAFVDALRKHLLNWRAMAGPQADRFVAQAQELFGLQIA